MSDDLEEIRQELEEIKATVKHNNAMLLKLTKEKRQGRQYAPDDDGLVDPDVEETLRLVRENRKCERHEVESIFDVSDRRATSIMKKIAKNNGDIEYYVPKGRKQSCLRRKSDQIGMQ